MRHHIDEGDTTTLDLTAQERRLIIALGLAILAIASAFAGVAEPTHAAPTAYSASSIS